MAHGTLAGCRLDSRETATTPAAITAARTPVGNSGTVELVLVVPVVVLLVVELVVEVLELVVDEIAVGEYRNVTTALAVTPLAPQVAFTV